MKAIMFLLIIISFSLSHLAHGKKKRQKKRKSRIAVVQIDGAAVYKVPNFDSPIVSYLNKGKKIRASIKLYPGIGGLGSFYKVRIKKGKYGYVTDVDLFPAPTTAAVSSAGNDGGGVFTPTGGEDPGPSLSGSSDTGTIYSSRYVGLSYNAVNFSQEIAGQKFSENRSFFGIKLSGPKALFTSLPLELNMMAALSAPAYYEKISEGAEGFSLLADLLYILPFLNQPQYMVYYGMGPVIAYNSFLVKVARSGGASPVELDSQTVNLGVSGVLGFAYKLGRSFVFKADAKYIYEKEGYLLMGAGLQIKF